MKKSKLNQWLKMLVLFSKIVFNYVDIITDINFIIEYRKSFVEKEKSFTVYSVYYLMIIAILYERIQIYFFLVDL